jgi:hypothetical protein
LGAPSSYRRASINTLIRAAERWRGLSFTEFELRQLAADTNDLKEEYQAAIMPQTWQPNPESAANARIYLRRTSRFVLLI